MQHGFDISVWIISSILLKYEQPLNYQFTEGTPYDDYNPKTQTDKLDTDVDTVNNYEF